MPIRAIGKTKTRRKTRPETTSPTPHFLQRGALLTRIVLMLPVLVAIPIAAPEEERMTLFALAIVWALTTMLAAGVTRRDRFTRDWVTTLSVVDFLILFIVTVVASPSILFALPAYSLLGYLQSLLWGRRGALLSALLALGAAIPVALIRAPESAADLTLIALWAFQNTTAVVLLGLYAEQQGKQLREVRREARRNREMALRDPLTGLYNRRFLDQRLSEEVARARRAGTLLSLAMIDVDHLKCWNDTFGHAAGDSALRLLGSLLRHSCRAGDVVCRIGGEEFVLLAPETDAEGLRALVDRIRATAAGIIQHEGEALPRPLTFSAGVATLEPTQTAQALLESADRTLYAAKQAGRNRVLMAAEAAGEADDLPPHPVSSLLLQRRIAAPPEAGAC